MDYTCSYHIMPNKDWFDTYMLVNSGSVMMDNDASCRVIGIGNIRVKTFDGVIITLCDVRHVLDLRKNMISLQTLDSNGFNYKFATGVMKLSKPVLTMMKGQKLVGNTYKSKGTIIVGGDATVEPELDSTTLWHMWLRHMGERGMMELHKRKLLKGIKTCKLELCAYCVFGKKT